VIEIDQRVHRDVCAPLLRKLREILLVAASAA
jgi:hypothetical protein